MKQYIVLLFIALSHICYVSASDSTYYYGSNYRPVNGMKEARYMIKTVKKGKKQTLMKTYYRDEGQWKQDTKRRIIAVRDGQQLIKTESSLLFSDKIMRYYEKTEEGLYTFRDMQKNTMIREGTATRIMPLNLQGVVQEYFPNGQLKSRSVYRNNQLQSNQNWLEDGTEYIDNIFYSVDSIPQYKPGNSFFRKYIMAGLKQSKYDITQVNERIVLGWVIMEDGQLVGVHQVSKGKLVKLPKILTGLVESLPGDWTPAKLNGRKVRYFMEVPFNFRNDVETLKSIELRGGMLFWD